MSQQHLVIQGWLPDQLANGSAGHWSARQKKLKAAQIMVWSAAKQADLQPVTGRARCTITLVFGNHRRRDLDNLYSRVKGLVDGLVKGGWLADDNSEVLELIVRADVRAGVKQTEICLESVAA